MKTMKAKDFRARARAALKGKWILAIVVTLIASILGGTLFTAFSTATSGAAGSVNEQTQTSTVVTSLQEKVQGMVDSLSEAEKTLFMRLVVLVLGFALTALAVGTLLGIVKFLLGGAVSFGYANFQFHLLDGKDAKFGDLFSRLKYIGKGIGMNFLIGLYVLLWSLLLIIPGIIKAFSYAMTPYILAEDPSLTVKQAIRKSRKLMNGNKWRLFCLNLSFIGWHILSGLTLGVGDLLLNPYIETANAAFYREIKAEKARERF